MSKLVSVAAFVAVAGIAAGVAWWALRGGPDGGSGGADGGRPPLAGVGDPADGAPGAAPRLRAANAPNRAGEPGSDELAVAGVVVGPDGEAVGGATVECYRVPDGEPDDEIRRARRALGGLLDDAEIEEIVPQMGGARVGGAAGAAAGGNGSPRAMRAGQRMISRVASDPKMLSRLVGMARDFGAGLEDDADLGAPVRVVTDAAGSFRFDGLRKGRAELRVSAPRFQRRKTRTDVGTTDVRVALERAGVVQGVVVCGDDPVPNAEVRFRSRAVRAGADGRFRYEAARPPREPVVASAPGYVTRGAWAPVDPARDGPDVVIRLDAAGRIEGRVTARDGAPIAGASVTIATDPGSLMAMFAPMLGGDGVPVAAPSATTGPDGTYAMDGVPARGIRLRADADGFLGLAIPEVRVPPRGVVANVDFVLARESVLEGRVTDAAGKPVAGAEVGVDVPGEGAMRMFAQFTGGIQRTGESDADGNYRVRGLPEGSRGATASADGYLRKKATVTLSAESATRLDFVLDPGFRVAGRVVAPDGSAVSGANVRATARGDRSAGPFAALLGAEGASARSGADGRFEIGGLQEGPYDLTASAAQWLDGSVSGADAGADVTITLGAGATLRGTVVAASDGKPVAGALVLRQGKSPRRGAGNPFFDMGQRDPSVTAAGDGTFEMTAVPPGSYEIRARAKGWADSAAVKVEAAAGGVLDGLTLALPPGSAVSGRVLRKADGTGVEGALVWVAEGGGGFRGPDIAEITGTAPQAPPDAVSAKTGADGSFTLDGLTPGKVTLEVRAEGFAPRTVAGTEVPSGSNVVEMSAGGALEGTVFDKTGVPTEGASVLLQQGMMGAGYMRTATSGRDGTFRIERIPPGTYSTLLLDPDSPMGMGGMSSVAIRDGETTRKDFGKRAAGAPVEGTVVADGAPVADATVMLVGGPAGFVLAQTDAAGRFRLDHVEAGDYSVMVQTTVSMGGGSPAGRVQVGADGKVQTLALEVSTLAVEGTVTDAETGKPIGFAQAVLLEGGRSGATLAEMLSSQKGQAFSDASGRFRVANVPKGSYSLRVTAAGYAEANVEGVSGGGQPVRVAMTRGLELAVTVVGPDDRPVAGATVVPEDAGGREGIAFDITMTKTTGPDGTARLRMQPGRYVVHVRATGFPAASVQTDAAAGTVTVRLEAGGALDVFVRAGTAPVAGATVKLLDAAGAAIDEAMTMSNFLGAGGTTDADGRARREGLRPGRVTVVAKTPSGREVRADATVVAGRTTTVDVQTE